MKNVSRTVNVENLGKVMKILSEPNRLRILTSMGLECVPVSAIIARTGLSQSNVSFHLRVLREANLVKTQRQGAFIFYCLYDTSIFQILEDLSTWSYQSEMYESDTPATDTKTII